MQRAFQADLERVAIERDLDGGSEAISYLRCEFKSSRELPSVGNVR